MIKVYEYRDITKKQEKSLRSKIDTFFETGNWDKSIPPFQTYGNLHLVPEADIFLKTFLQSCSEYIGRPIEPTNLLMWCYMDYRNNYKKVKKMTGTGYHKHDMEQGGQLSGVYYLVNPRNEVTIFKDMESPKAKPFTWVIYPPSLNHRPPDIKSFRRRYTIAADVFY
jgi:hypothetical protein